MATDVVALPMLEGAPAGLNSPPDSNPALKDPNSDSDLSDLEPDQAEQMFMSDSPPVPKLDAKFVPKHEATDVLDIQPIDIQGGVPIFKPSMEEFSDFIRCKNARSSISDPSCGKILMNCYISHEFHQPLWHEVGYRQSNSPEGMG